MACPEPSPQLAPDPEIEARALMRSWARELRATGAGPIARVPRDVALLSEPCAPEQANLSALIAVADLTRAERAALPSIHHPSALSRFLSAGQDDSGLRDPFLRQACRAVALGEYLRACRLANGSSERRLGASALQAFPRALPLGIDPLSAEGAFNASARAALTPRLSRWLGCAILGAFALLAYNLPWQDSGLTTLLGALCGAYLGGAVTYALLFPPSAHALSAPLRLAYPALSPALARRICSWARPLRSVPHLDERAERARLELLERIAAELREGAPSDLGLLALPELRSHPDSDRLTEGEVYHMMLSSARARQERRALEAALAPPITAPDNSTAPSLGPSAARGRL